MIHGIKSSPVAGILTAMLIAAFLVLFHSCSDDDGAGTVEPTDEFPDPGKYTITMKVDTLTREFMIIIPPGYDNAKPHPLLLCFHGGNLSMGFMFNNRKDLIQRCEEEDWLLVFPNGYTIQPDGSNRTWNAIHCCNPAHKYGVDDVGFARKIVDTVSSILNVDAKRIYAMGGSNGGMLTQRLAAEMSDILAAAAPNQSTIGGQADSLSPVVTVQPVHPIPIMMIHGLSDKKVNYFGGKTLEGDRIDISFEESVLFWAAVNQCDAATADTVVTQGQNGRVWTVSFRDCNPATEVRAVTIENKGHGWPGLEESGFDGTNASVDFLKQFSK